MKLALSQNLKYNYRLTFLQTYQYRTDKMLVLPAQMISPFSNNSNFNCNGQVDPCSSYQENKKNQLITVETSTNTIIRQNCSQSNDNTCSPCIFQQDKINFKKINSKRRSPPKIKNYKKQNSSKVPQKSFTEEYQKILSESSEFDLSGFYKNQQKLVKETDKIFTQWQRSGFYQNLLEKFLCIFHEKVINVSYTKSFLPTLYQCYEKISQRLNFQPRISKRALRISLDQCLTDQLFTHFAQEQTTKTTRNGEYFVRDAITDKKILLKDFIAKTQGFDFIYWPKIFKIVQATIQQDYDKQSPNKLMQQYNQKKALETIPDLKCLGCTSFFYQNQDIFNPQSQHKTVLMGKVKSLSLNLAQLKEEITGLLNNKGGIILFDCFREYFDFKVNGERITQIEKEEIEKTILSCLNEIQPSPQADKEVKVTFVPVREDPYRVKGLLKRNQAGIQYVQRKFIDGQFVVRIKVTPSSGSRAYFWMQNEKPVFTVRLATLTNFPSSKEHIVGRKIAPYLKNKFAQYKHEHNEKTSERRFVLHREFRDITHQCKVPEQAAFYVEKRKDESDTTIQSQQRQFKYASTIVVKHMHHETILQKLKRKSINCKIQIRFQSYKLKGIANVAILHHDIKYDQLLQLVNYNKQFQFDGRYLLIIPITPYLRLQDRNAKNIMSQLDFDSLAGWLKKEFKNQSLKMLQFTPRSGGIEYYIQSGSIASTLFMFIVMSTFNEKCQFKVNKSIERMSQTERQQSLKLYYNVQ